MLAILTDDFDSVKFTVLEDDIEDTVFLTLEFVEWNFILQIRQLSRPALEPHRPVVSQEVQAFQPLLVQVLSH